MNSKIIRLTVEHLANLKLREVAVCVAADDDVELGIVSSDGVDLVGMIIAAIAVALMTDQHENLRPGAAQCRYDCLEFLHRVREPQALDETWATPIRNARRVEPNDADFHAIYIHERMRLQSGENPCRGAGGCEICEGSMN